MTVEEGTSAEGGGVGTAATTDFEADSQRACASGNGSVQGDAASSGRGMVMAPSAAPPLASVIDDNNLLQLMQIDAYLAQLNKQLCDGVPRNARDALDMAGKLPLALKTHSIVMWSLAPHPPRARWPALMLFRARLPSPLTGRVCARRTARARRLSLRAGRATTSCGASTGCICATATCLAPLPLPRAPMCVAAACARVLAVRLCLPRAHSVPHGQVMVTKDKAQKGKVRAGCPAVPPAARSPGAA